MKGNSGIGNNESRDSWQTPQVLWNLLHEQYNFNLDCCATKDNTKTSNYCTDFLKRTFYFNIVGWMNPPFSKSLEMFKHFFNYIKNGVAIYRCDNFETKIWQHIIFPKASWIFIPNKRIAYEGFKGNSSRFPSALIGFNVPVPKGLEGITLKVCK